MKRILEGLVVVIGLIASILSIFDHLPDIMFHFGIIIGSNIITRITIFTIGLVLIFYPLISSFLYYRKYFYVLRSKKYNINFFEYILERFFYKGYYNLALFHINLFKFSLKLKENIKNAIKQ